MIRDATIWCVAFVLAMALTHATALVVICAPLSPARLLVEDRVRPIGVDDRSPEFSWLPRDAEPGAVQSAYHIVVGSSRSNLEQGIADKWDSGAVRSSQSGPISYAGRPLQSREVCFWKIRSADASGFWGPWSEPSRFEMGLLENGDWQGRWIWRPQPLAGHDYVYFRKQFALPNKPIDRARVYVSSVHHHALYVNGHLVGKGPNFAYPEYQYYQTFDVGAHLKPAVHNLFALRVHWFGKGQGRPASTKGMIFQGVIDFSDGTSLVIGSDGSWKTRPAEWILTNRRPYRNGEGIPTEFIDGRLHPVGWTQKDYDDSEWSVAHEIGPHPTAPWTGPMISQETLLDEYVIAPVDVRRLGTGHYVADFGKVYSGMPRVGFQGGTPGSVVWIKGDYRQQKDGTLKGFAQRTRLNYEYTLRGGEETFEPFWYLGFRYLELENCPDGFDGSSIRMVVRHHRVDWAQSSFESSSSMLNSIWDLVKRSAMLGSQECFVDTPTREQGQFTYDSYQTSLAAMKCFGERDLSQKGLREFAQSQEKWHADTGVVNAVYPNGGKRDTPDWTQSWVFWAWEYFLETGDLDLVQDIFPQLVNVGLYNKASENQATGLIDWGNDPGYASGIVDWPVRYEYDRTTTQRTVLSGNAYLNYRYVAQLATALGEDETAARFHNYADRIRHAMQKHLWSDAKRAYVDGLYANGAQSTSTSQQTNMVMLALGVAGGNRQRGALQAVRRAGHKTAPMLIRFLVQAYGEHDQDDALMEYLLNPKGRNWAYIVADGGTFTYENWRGRLVTVVNEDSESHPVGALGGVIALQNYVLGIQPLKPQYARVKIRPHVGDLDFARGKIPTQRGPIAVDWQVRDARSFHMELTLPCNVQADVYLPSSSGEGGAVLMDGAPVKARDEGRYLLVADVGSGRHVFELKH